MPATIPVVASPDTETLIDFPLRLTPQTIIIDADGRVASVLTGAPKTLGAARMRELSQQLGVVPPGDVIDSLLR